MSPNLKIAESLAVFKRRLRHTTGRKSGLLPALVCILAAGLAAAGLACAGPEEPTPTSVNTPASALVTTAESPTGSPAYQAGMKLFDANCALCHGPRAAGTDAGPPLVHRLYVPSHHPDFSFHAAVNNGVTTHHWFFGDMPPVPGLSEGDVDNIICYVRTQQRDGGLPVNVTC